jgi:hypothetical protein
MLFLMALVLRACFRLQYWKTMTHLLLRHCLLVFTILSLLGQGVLANGASMVTNEMMLSPASHNMTHNVPQLDNKDSPESDCHNLVPTSLPNEMQPAPAPDCCDGPHECDSDCTHCLSIVLTANLFSAFFNVPQQVPSTRVRFASIQFRSQDGATAFRPPIA